MFAIKKCRDKGGYSVKPLKNIRLEIGRLKDEFEVVADTPILYVIRDECEIIVHGYGELVFKNFSDVKKIREKAEKIYKLCAR